MPNLCKFAVGGQCVKVGALVDTGDGRFFASDVICDGTASEKLEYPEWSGKGGRA